MSVILRVDSDQGFWVIINVRMCIIGVEKLVFCTWIKNRPSSVWNPCDRHPEGCSLTEGEHFAMTIRDIWRYSRHKNLFQCIRNIVNRDTWCCLGGTNALVLKILLLGKIVFGTHHYYGHTLVIMEHDSVWDILLIDTCLFCYVGHMILTWTHYYSLIGTHNPFLLYGIHDPYWDTLLIGTYFPFLSSGIHDPDWEILVIWTHALLFIVFWDTWSCLGQIANKKTSSILSSGTHNPV